jgi:hypothetical protein
VAAGNEKQLLVLVPSSAMGFADDLIASAAFGSGLFRFIIDLVAF